MPDATCTNPACTTGRPVFAKKLCRPCWNADAASRRAPDGSTRRTDALPLLACGRCGLKFKATGPQRRAADDGRTVYCTRDCQKGSKHVTLPCAACGDDVVRRECDVKSATQRVFCNGDCRNKASKPKTGSTAPCPNCGVDVYSTPKVKHTYCSRHCRIVAQNRTITNTCDQCGKEYARAQSIIGRYCSRVCTHAAANGAGTGHINGDGYMVQSVNGKPKLEHRLVAAKLLGRDLLRSEEVHHRDGVRSHNSTDGPFVLTEDGKLKSGNLEVWSTSQPAGQEIGPKLEWAIEMLETYQHEMTDAMYAKLAFVTSRQPATA